MLVSASGKVWIGTDGNGLFALEPGTGKLTSYRTDADDPASLIDDHVSVLLEDRAHNLWVGTTNGLTRIDAAGHIVQFQHDRNDPSSLAFHGVESMFQDAGGVMWVGGFTVGVCKFNEFRMKFGYHHTGNLATSFHEDADGTLWAGTYNDGLYKLERAARFGCGVADRSASRIVINQPKQVVTKAHSFGCAFVFVLWSAGEESVNCARSRFLNQKAKVKQEGFARKFPLTGSQCSAATSSS